MRFFVQSIFFATLVNVVLAQQNRHHRNLGSLDATKCSRYCIIHAKNTLDSSIENCRIGEGVEGKTMAECSTEAHSLYKETFEGCKKLGSKCE